MSSRSSFLAAERGEDSLVAIAAAGIECIYVRLGVRLTARGAYTQIMQSRRTLAAGVVGLLMVAPASALAARQPGLTPPGNSAIDEYVEAVPTAAGPTAVGTVATRKASPREPAVALRARRALESDGQAGRQLIAIAAATAPSRITAAKSGTGAQGDRVAGNGRSTSPRRRPNHSPGESRVRSVLRAAEGGSSGLGWALPLLLGGTLAAAVVSTLAGRRAARYVAQK